MEPADANPRARIGLRLRWTIPILVLLSAATALAFYVIRDRASIDKSYDATPLPGRWDFANSSSAKASHPILLDFQRDWGKPGGDERIARPSAWKARMTALTRLARLGASATPILVGGLEDRDEEIRNLSSQALGYFGDRSAVPRLDRAIREDPSTTVRIYSAISRGSIEGDFPQELATEILKKDPSSMVRARLELARNRAASQDTSALREAFASYDLGLMDTARIGQPAPDFRLTDLSGAPCSLSDYRGKKDVVLVFVYGVTCFFCTGQAANLRHKLPEFEAAGVQVLVVEANESYRVSATAKESNLEQGDPRLKLLLDPAHVAAATYGVAMQMNHIEWLNRPSTFLIDRQGILRTSFLSKGPADRPTADQLLAEIRSFGEGGESADSAASASTPKRAIGPVPDTDK